MMAKYLEVLLHSFCLPTHFGDRPVEKMFLSLKALKTYATTYNPCLKPSCLTESCSVGILKGNQVSELRFVKQIVNK